MTDWRWHAASPAFEQGVQRDIQVACALYHGSVCQVPMSLNSVMDLPPHRMLGKQTSYFWQAAKSAARA